MRRALRPTLALGLAAPLLACSAAPPEGSQDAGPAAADIAAEPSRSGEVVARLGDREVHMGELEEWIKEQLYRDEMDEQNATGVYEIQSRYLERLVDQTLLEAEARERGVELEALLREAAENAPEPGDPEVRQFYDQNRQRIGDQEFEAIAPRIREFLAAQAQQEAQQAFLASLREEGDVEILLEPPRVEVAASGPSRGPEDAPITLIEFSDYQCPFCQRSEEVVKQVLERYGDRVQFVYRHFPLDRIHPRARPAAEAAACAEKQGEFWAFHDKLFTEGAFAHEDFTRYAQEIGLDAEAFATCVEERATQELVEADLEAGREAGVSGTPAFFINGIPLSGARSFDEFVRVIDRELAEQG